MNNNKKPEDFRSFFKSCREYCMQRLLPLTRSKHDAEDFFAEAIAKYWV